MSVVDLAVARAHFSELVARAAEGETFEIVRRGKPAARLTAAAARKPVALSALRAITDAMPVQTGSAGDFMRCVREDDRY